MLAPQFVGMPQGAFERGDDDLPVLTFASGDRGGRSRHHEARETP
ncbi:MAG: hypothetical protein ABI658_28365 [Acidimicrobiales bacterium]